MILFWLGTLVGAVWALMVVGLWRQGMNHSTTKDEVRFSEPEVSDVPRVSSPGHIMPSASVVPEGCVSDINALNDPLTSPFWRAFHEECQRVAAGDLLREVGYPREVAE